MRIFRISCHIYSWTLILAIPFYLLLYGATGHGFNFTNEDVFWMCCVLGAILSYYINRRSHKPVTRVLAGAFATFILYGTVQIAWDQLNFKFGDDVGIIIALLFMLWPLVFLTATALFIYSLFLTNSITE